jgi:signal transduction histidine kinase
VSIVAAVVQFAVVGLVAVSAVALFTAHRLRSESNVEAVRDARDWAQLLAEGIVAPRVTDELLAGDPAAIARMDRIVHALIVRDPVIRMKLWTQDGRVAYSDDHRLIGQTFELEDEVQEAFRTGRAFADVSTLDADENRLDPGPATLLEAYEPIRTPSGQLLMYEDYQKFSAVSAGAHRLSALFSPVVLGSLILLELLQLPLAWSLARRVRASQRQRAVLLQQALDASDTERRRIAHDLHDGIVQDLVGVSYAVNAVRQDPMIRASAGAEATLEEVVEGTQRSIRGLRTLLVDIYPPSLEDGDLAGSLTDLLAPFNGAGMMAELEYRPTGALTTVTQALIYRVAREALKNVQRHAGASIVQVRVNDYDEDHVVLEVTDNGRGFEPMTLIDKPAEGHIGLHLLDDLASGAGGVLEIDSGLGEGTIVRLVAPR